MLSLILAPVPAAWSQAIRLGNVQVDALRRTVRTPYIAAEFLLPLTERLPPATGKFLFDMPLGSKLEGARLVKEQASLGLTWQIPRLISPIGPHTVIVVPSTGDLPTVEQGWTRKLVGVFHWKGSWRVLTEFYGQ